MCEYCKGHNNRCLSMRQRSLGQKRPESYVGFDVYVEAAILQIATVADTYEPSYMEKGIKINYCPMCGRDLEGVG